MSAKNIIVLIATILLGITLVNAAKIDNVRILDTLAEDLLVNEDVTLLISNNTADIISFLIPEKAYNIIVGDESFNTQDGIVSAALGKCAECVVHISYTIEDAISKEDDGGFIFSRTLNLQDTPEYITYDIMMPAGYFVQAENKSNNPSIVPAISSVKSNGKNIILEWSEAHPNLPKRYFVRYYEEEHSENTIIGIESEFSEFSVWVIIFLSLLTGILIGFIILHYHKRKWAEKDLPYVPASLLSPDEISIIRILQQNSNINQKEVGRKLDWSKSKVSAVMTNLQYKSIIKRKKIGRNYDVSLIKDIAD